MTPHTDAAAGLSCADASVSTAVFPAFPNPDGRRPRRRLRETPSRAPNRLRRSAPPGSQRACSRRSARPGAGCVPHVLSSRRWREHLSPAPGDMQQTRAAVLRSRHHFFGVRNGGSTPGVCSPRERRREPEEGQRPLPGSRRTGFAQTPQRGAAGGFHRAERLRNGNPTVALIRERGRSCLMFPVGTIGPPGAGKDGVGLPRKLSDEKAGSWRSRVCHSNSMRVPSPHPCHTTFLTPLTLLTINCLNSQRRRPLGLLRALLPIPLPHSQVQGMVWLGGPGMPGTPGFPPLVGKELGPQQRPKGVTEQPPNPTFAGLPLGLLPGPNLCRRSTRGESKPH